VNLKFGRWSGPTLRRLTAGALVVLALAVLASIGYASGRGLLGLSYTYGYQYCTTPSQYQYCSTSTSTTSTTTPTTTSTSTSTSTTTSTTTPTSTKPGKGCGDKNHLHERRFECKVVISGVSKKEGKAGTTTVFSFSVTLSANALSPVSVSYATANGTATSPSDYLATSGTLTFPTGSSAKTITVTVIGDKVKEPNETFYVNLSNPSPNAYLGVSQGVGTIQNDD